MADYNFNAIHVLNKYIASRLATLSLIQSINGLQPIFPSQEPPEVANTKSSFITYSFSTVPSFDLYCESIDTIAYNISAATNSLALKLYNGLFDIIKGEDDLASAVNKYIYVEYTSSFAEEIYDFKNVRIISSTGPGPADEEGGRIYAQIVVSSRYTTLLDANGLRAH